jgi:prepilin-type N-terminal cleavage/methylation domain-containing protein
MTPAQRGFSLIEVLITSSILVFLMAAVFWAFGFGSRAFFRSTTQQNAQADMTRAYSKIRKDLRQTHFRSVHTKERTFPDSRRRDAVCMSSLKNWHDEASFDEKNGLPKWDRYVVYYGTASGHLVRSLLDPEFPDFSPAPFWELSDGEHLNDNPTNNNDLQSSYQVISRSVQQFEIQLDPSRDMVLVKFLLKSEQGRKTETSELRFDVSPQNTWPQA